MVITTANCIIELDALRAYDAIYACHNKHQDGAWPVTRKEDRVMCAASGPDTRHNSRYGTAMAI